MKITHTNMNFPCRGKVILFLMRAFIGLFCMVAFGFTSNHGFPQTTIKIDADTTMTVYQVLNLIKKQTKGTTLLYDPALFSKASSIALQKGRIKVDTLFEKIRDAGNFKYEYTADKTVVFSKGTDTPTPKSPQSQQLRVTGTVTGAPDGAPLPGVNIIVKGTSSGTTSEFDGTYSLEVEETDVLVFSHVGYKVVEKAVNGRGEINVKLEEDVTALRGVEVQAGYWTVTERERTGNISRLTAAEIGTQPVANVMAAAIGRMPGVNIQQNTGLPGGNFRIRIRGQNSLRSSANEPLYVIDGVPFTSTSLADATISGSIFLTNAGGYVSPLNAINPEDIESIEILKDADATAIYGSRGANGVVLITTKKGGIGKTTVDVNFQRGIGKVANFMELLNIDQYLEMRKEAIANDGIEPGATDYDLNGTWDPNRNVDWQKRMIGGMAETTNAQLSISGGNENTQYVFNGGYYRETTVFPGDFAYQRGSGQLNINHISENQKFKVNLSTSFSKDKNNLPGEDITRRLLTLSPNAPEPFNEDGSINWADGTWGFLGSPFVHLKRPYDSNTENLITNGVFGYKLLPGLELKTNLGYTTTRFKESVLFPINTNDPASGIITGSARFGDSNIRTWIAEPQVEYQQKIGKGMLNILIGTTFQEEVRESQRINTSGIGSDALLKNIGAATTLTASNSFSEYRYNAVFGRIHYNWDEKYLINLTGRRDGSSRFGPGKRFGNFGAIGGAWVFSNEGFVKNNLPFLSFGKLRSSYGTTGNDQIGDYGYLDAYSSRFPYLGGTTLIPARIANPDYSWEVNKKFEAGLEMGIFKDRVSLSASYYRNHSSNQLVGFSLPAITGFTSVQANLLATVQNTGWELELITRNVLSGDFHWTTSANLTIPRNKLVDYPDLESSPYANTYVVGEPLNIAKTYQSLGVDPETGEYQFQDVDGDGNISFPNDRQTVVETGQRYYGGVNNSLSYKGLQVNFFFQFVKQTRAAYRASFPSPGFVQGISSNQPVEVMDRWQHSGDITDISKFSTGFSSFISYLNWKDSKQAYEDASFIRLKNISLSWNLPAELTHKLKLQQARIYIQGRNLWTITNYRGLDPESASIVLPPLRRITTGIQITF